MDEAMRQCNKCGEYRDTSEFHFKDKATGRHHTTCKHCMIAVNHHYYWRDRTRQRARKMPKVERVCHTCGTTFEVHQSALRRGEGNYCDPACYRKAQRIYGMREDYFAEIDTPDKAYWLGFIATDGNSDGEKALRIRLKDDDVDHLRTFAACLGTNAPITYGVNNLGARYADLRVFSATLIRDLERHGITRNKSWTVKPWSGPPNLLSHYWRGALDGDGWIRCAPGKAQPYVVGFCGNTYMVHGFREFCSTLGATGTLNERHKGFWQVQYGSLRATQLILPILYNQAEVFLPRKKVLADEVMRVTAKWRQVLTREDADTIRARYAEGGISQSALAASYGVRQPHISKIVRGLRH